MTLEDVQESWLDAGQEAIKFEGQVGEEGVSLKEFVAKKAGAQRGWQDFSVEKCVAEEGGVGSSYRQDLDEEIDFTKRVGLLEKVEEIIREGEKEVDEQNHRLKIADDFRLPFFGDSIKEDLARDDKEEKKQKKRKLSELRRRLSECQGRLQQRQLVA